MNISGKAGMLKIYVGESDKVHGKLLYEEIIQEARKAGMAGATAYNGIMSFGASHSVHTLKVFALSNNLPVVIEIVDSIEKLDEFAGRVNELMDLSMKGGLVLLQEADIIRYESGSDLRDKNM